MYSLQVGKQLEMHSDNDNPRLFCEIDCMIVQPMLVSLQNKQKAKLNGTNVDITHYEYSALTIRTCNKPITTYWKQYVLFIFSLSYAVLFSCMSVPVFTCVQVAMAENPTYRRLSLLVFDQGYKV